MTPAQVAHITPPLPFAVFDEFGKSCEDRVADHYRAAIDAALRDAPQQAEGWVMVPVDVLKAASESLGSFVSDHGWGDADMQAMDNLDAYLAARPSAPAAVEPDAPLKWCGYCGEGVTSFCRGKQSPDWDYKCPVLNLPARASRGTP